MGSNTTVHVRRVRQREWTIYARARADGHCPLLQHLAGLDGATQRKFAALMQRAAEHGPDKVAGDSCHQIEGDIWQFRARQLRVLWFYDAGQLVVCAHSIVKKRGKTPRSAIKKAHAVRAEYLAAKQARCIVVLDS